MKLFLFGGAEIETPDVSPGVLKDLIKKTLTELNPQSILHVPFARLHSFEEEWKEGWFKEEMTDTGITILDARSDSDIAKATDSVIFINGGIERKELINSINRNPLLHDLILSAKFIVAESAGSMIMGEYMTADRSGNEIIKALGVLKNTIIEVHYSERNRQDLLFEDMRKTGMKYGIGIDCATALVVDPLDFPKKYEKIGVGKVYLNAT
jgi:cyanophycinase-like exopeptidase